MLNKIIHGDALEVLKTMPDGSVNCCVTSPPYYGLRDYGVSGQIGLEETPEQYVNKLVSVFRELRRVLKADGVLWLNIGDSYASNEIKHGVKPKDLIGIPWLLAFALRADGWYLRQDIIWAKPNPMPESVTDRCTKSHEYIFLLTKSAKYFYDADAIKEEFADLRMGNPRGGGQYAKDCPWVGGRVQTGLQKGTWNSNGSTLGRNKRSVWTITTKPCSEAHFATFPIDLPINCIKAGCPQDGTVIDPFTGAGTTLLAAWKLERQYVGIELNEEYIKIADHRLKEEKSQMDLFRNA